MHAAVPCLYMLQTLFTLSLVRHMFVLFFIFFIFFVYITIKKSIVRCECGGLLIADSCYCRPDEISSDVMLSAMWFVPW